MATLFDRVTFYLAHDQRKHDLPSDHVEKHINQMTNTELLQAISDALQEEKDECKDG